MSQKVLSYDLGGTKIAAGVIQKNGRIIDEIRIPSEFHRGKSAVLKTIVEIGNQFLSRHPDIKAVGIASAGPLDPFRAPCYLPLIFLQQKMNGKKYPSPAF